MWHFCCFFGNFTPPTLALVFCHLACYVEFVFCHVALLLCCLGLLSRCIYCCAPPLCYVASLFCFFFSFLVCISWPLLRFCSLSSSLASSFSSSSILHFVFACFLHSRCASVAFVLLSYICFFFACLVLGWLCWVFFQVVLLLFLVSFFFWGKM